MKIGTPLTASATRALLLGSGELGKEIAISLQRYGVEVIAVDRYPNAPAMQVAHRSHVIDMTDAVAVKALMDQEQPHLVIPELEAIATQALAALERDSGLQVVPNARAIQLTMNREGIRQLAAEELQLPTSAYAFAETFEQLVKAVDAGIQYPCFIKPTMSSSGKGQSMVKNPDQLPAAWAYAKAGGRTDTGKVIVEGKVDFDFEITLLTVRALNAHGEVETHFCQPIGHVQEDGDYRESWQPQVMTAQALQSAQQIADKVTTALGGLGLFGVELFVKGDQVWFSEVSPRPHDTGMVTMASQRQNEFELHVRAILGLPVDTRLLSAAASAVILGGVDSPEVTYSGLEQALAIADTEIRLFGKPEAFVRRRMGVALATAETTDLAREKALDAARAITVKKLR